MAGNSTSQLAYCVERINSKRSRGIVVVVGTDEV